MGPLVAGLVTGSFVIEFIFSIPGMGSFFITAVTNRDYPLIMGVTLVYAVLIVLANIVVDMMYACMARPQLSFSGEIIGVNDKKKIAKKYDPCMNNFPLSSRLSALFLLGIALAAIFAPWVAPYSYETQDTMNTLASPNQANLMGTDRLGRDLFSRMIYGARVSLFVGVVTTLGWRSSSERSMARCRGMRGKERTT